MMKTIRRMGPYLGAMLCIFGIFNIIIYFN